MADDDDGAGWCSRLCRDCVVAVTVVGVCRSGEIDLWRLLVGGVERGTETETSGSKFYGRSTPPWQEY